MRRTLIMLIVAMLICALSDLASAASVLVSWGLAGTRWCGRRSSAARP